MTAAVVESMKVLPLGTPLFTLFSIEGARAWIRGIMFLSVRMVLPYFGTLLLAELGLGFIARMVPQMNVFMLGFPVKILLGIFLVSVFAISIIRGLLPGAVMDFLGMFTLFWGR